MQLCALDKEDNLVFVDQALKQQDYFCLECRAKVRVRRGMHRQAHYYHLQPNHICRMNGKGIIHLMLQRHIQNLLLSCNTHIEYRFPSIGRIADVACLSKKLIFEIQCAPIDSEEVLARNQAYNSLGYQVIWILHDSRYNQYKISPAEHVLKDFPHYFSNMNNSGEGMIYDHFSVYHKGTRLHRFPSLPVDLSLPLYFHKDKNIALLQDKLPKPLLQRLSNWPLGFAGDCIDRCLKLMESPDEHSHIELATAINLLLQTDQKITWNVCKQALFKFIATPYLAALRLLLERFSR